MKVRPLTKGDIEKRLKKLSDWTVNTKATELSHTIHTHSFLHGLSLLARISVHAEILGHHPDIELTYHKIKIKLTTHEVKGLTKLDFDLAERISRSSIE